LMQSHDFEKATIAFSKIRDDSSVQEPTRTWAGIEAIATTYLSGKPDAAAENANLISAHISTIPKKTSESMGTLLDVIRKLKEPAPIPVNWLDISNSNTSNIMVWMLAGLKNWEQGDTIDAVGFFSAVTTAKIPQDSPWLVTYQKLANDYLLDHRSLSAQVFHQLPQDLAGCLNAMAELNAISSNLKTNGYAQSHVKSRQSDFEKHAKQFGIQ
jgi:eukaryotic-like serine/threonine-protein kinase